MYITKEHLAIFYIGLLLVFAILGWFFGDKVINIDKMYNLLLGAFLGTCISFFLYHFVGKKMVESYNF
jgi:hypothetical protein